MSQATQPNTTSPDAELIHLCLHITELEATYDARAANRHSIAAEQQVQPQLDAISAEQRKVIDRIADLPAATTIEGASAMAAAALALEPDAPSDDAPSRFAWKCLQFLAGASVASDADAELIQACKRIEDLAAEERDLRRSKAGEDQTASRLDALLDAQFAEMHRIVDLPNATTMAGARAMARAGFALETTERMPDYESEWLYYLCAKFLAGSATA